MNARQSYTKRFLQLAALAFPVAVLGVADVVVAVNTLLKWRDFGDGALVGVPVFIALQVGLPLGAAKLIDVNRGMLVMARAFAVSAWGLSAGTLFQMVADPVQDPLFPPFGIVLIVLVFLSIPMAIGTWRFEQAVRQRIRIDEGEIEDPGTSSSNMILAGLLLMIGGVGIHGLHRIYTRRFISGAVMLFTFGWFFMWWLLDLTMMLSELYSDGRGQRLQKTRWSVILILGILFALLLAFAIFNYIDHLRVQSYRQMIGSAS